MTKGQKGMTVALARPDLSTRKAGSLVGVNFIYISRARQVLDADRDLADATNRRIPPRQPNRGGIQGRPERRPTETVAPGNSGAGNRRLSRPQEGRKLDPKPRAKTLEWWA